MFLLLNKMFLLQLIHLRGNVVAGIVFARVGMVVALVGAIVDAYTGVIFRTFTVCTSSTAINVRNQHIILTL